MSTVSKKLPALYYLFIKADGLDIQGNDPDKIIGGHRGHVKHFSKSGIFLCLALILALLPGMALVTDAVVTVDVFTTNDIHGVVEASDAAIGLEQAAAIAAAGSNSILVDAGDATQGASFATISEGRDVIALMNAAGYEVITAGNHEFDFGVERQGLKIAFIGVTMVNTLSNANPAGLEGVTFENEIAAVKRELAALEGKADAIVLVCHLGNSDAAVTTTSKALLDGLSDKELALVTAVVDGHSHTLEDGTPYERGGKSVPVVRVGTQLAALGHLTLTFSGGTVAASGTGLLLRTKVSGSFLQISSFTYTYDPAGESGSKVTGGVLDDGTKLDRSDSATAILLATNGYVASSVTGIADGEQLGELGGEDAIIRDYLLELTAATPSPSITPSPKTASSTPTTCPRRSTPSPSPWWI